MFNSKQPYRQLSEDQLRKYLDGQLSGEEANKIERLMLESSFEAEAMEGWELFENEDISQDLTKLRAALSKKRTKKGLPWLKIAASILLISAIGLAAWMVSFSSSKSELLAENSSTKDLEEEVAPEDAAGDAPVAETDIEKGEELDHMTADKLTKKLENVSKIDNQESQSEPAFLREIELEESRLNEDRETIATRNQLDQPDVIEEIEVEYDQLAAGPAPLPNTSTAVASMPSEQVAKEKSAFNEEMNSTGTMSRSTISPTKTVVGIVKGSETGEGLPGVNVIPPGSSTGVSTDINGQFSIDLGPKDESLVFSYIGFKSQTVSAAEYLEVNLESDEASLSEVVITGYRAQRNLSPPAQPSVGEKAFKNYIKQNLIYPALALENNISGIVKLNVEVEASGDIGEIEIIRSLGYGCDEEAIRLVKEGPPWNPALSSGDETTSQVMIKIRFRQP